jgi:hypothetical protein
MRFVLNKNGFHHHHIQSRDGSPQKSVSGLHSCDISAAHTKTARFPKENRAVSKPVNSGEVLMGCQKCTSMREKRQSLQVRAT